MNENILRIQAFCAAIFLILSILESVCFAGQVSIDASVDKNTVSLDDVVQYTITISGKGINNATVPSIPSFSNLKVVSKSQSSNISIVNMQVNTAHSYVYVLSPEKEGTANIGISSVVVGGNTYQSQPISITVTKPTGEPKQSSQRQQGRGAISSFDIFDDFFAQRHRSHSAEQVSKPVFASTTLSRHTCYVNQMVILTLTFYRRVNLMDAPSYTPPSTIGFWSVQLPSKKDERYENIKGIQYLAQDLKTALFPTQSGELTIGSATIIARLDPFSAPITLRTNPLKIKVLPLPKQGKGKDSTSIVGRFTMSATVDKRIIERGKPFTLKVEVNGTGNIQAIPEPLIRLDDNLKKLSVHAADRIVKGFDSVSGRKTFEYVIMPIKEGNGNIWPVKLVCFDPSAGKYIELSSNPFKIKILPSNIPLPEEIEKDAKLLEKIEKKVFKVDKRIIIKALQIISMIILLVTIIFIIRWAIKKYRSYLHSNPIMARQQMAMKNMKKARHSLKKAKRLLEENLLKESVASSYDAVVGYLGDKYNFASIGITQNQLKDILSQQGIMPDVMQELDKFIFECDMIRWTLILPDKGKVEEIIRMAEGLVMGKMWDNVSNR